MKTKKFLRQMSINELSYNLAVCMPSYLKEKNSTVNLITGASQFHIESDHRNEKELVYNARLVGSSKTIPLSRNMQDFERMYIFINLPEGTIAYSTNDDNLQHSGEDCFLWERYGTIYIAFQWTGRPVIAEISPDYNCIYLYHSAGDLSTIASRFLNPKDHLMAKSILDVRYQLAAEIATAMLKKESLTV